MPWPTPRAPVELSQVFDQPGHVRELAQALGPYWSVQRYVANVEEAAAVEGRRLPEAERHAPMLVLPWFRADWANESQVRPGVEALLRHPPFIDAARRLFGLPVVEPCLLYINLNPPLPAADQGHVDVPAFVGMDRTHYPIWWLTTMLRSGLFDEWYIPTATAVAWFYEGEGGGFRYWADGPDALPRSRACRSNTALVGDNDRMFHCIERVGAQGVAAMMGLSLDSQLRWDGARWEVFEGARVLGHYNDRDVRISLSWKAQVFDSEAQRDRARRGEGGLDQDRVVDTWVCDLRARGHELQRPQDPVHDRDFIALLNRAYHIPLRRS